MLGAIAGDVLGSPYEFGNVKSTEIKLFGRDTRCTDDTVLTVATADVLLNDLDYAIAYETYYQLYPNAGYGGRFVQWAARGERKPYNSWGNGSAMRVSPVGWAKNTLDEVLDEAQKSAAVTHDHPEGIRGAQAIAAAVFLARTERSRERIREFIADGCGYPIDFTLDEIRPGYSFDVSCQGTVPVAVKAFLESSDFENAVRLGISVGGDSDTIACITGAIAHAFYGGVPEHIRKPVCDIYLQPDLMRTTLAFCERFDVPL